MGAFATDHTLCDEDLAALRQAARGDQRALRIICERFKFPVLAAAIRQMKCLERSFAAVQPVLSSLCDGLLNEHFRPESWVDQLLSEVAGVARQELKNAESDDAANPPSLSGFASVPRLARRRIVRESLPELSLPELTAVLMQYLDHCTPSQMVGLVDTTESAVCARLASAHQRLQQALQEQIST
jgi:hypothetical protein